jgi:hypothetical protein
MGTATDVPATAMFETDVRMAPGSMSIEHPIDVLRLSEMVTIGVERTRSEAEGKIRN